MKDSRLAWFDFVRGVSALIVSMGHLRLAITVDHESLDRSSVLTSLFYGVTGLGHQAVMVFFVLSGYFVGGSVLSQGPAFRWSRYAVARVTRLWIVLIPALVWTFAVDRTIAQFQPETLTGAYYELWMTGPIPEAYSASVGTFLSNVFFLQTTLTPVFGTNGPLWSLAYEAFFYVLFPLVMFAIGRCGQGSAFARVFALTLAATLWLAIDREKRIGFAVWSLGALVAYLSSLRPAPYSRWLALLGCVSLGGALVYSKSVDWDERHELPVSSDFAVGLGSTLLLYSLLNAPVPRFANELFTRVSFMLSEISYTLYLFHFPLVALIGARYYGQDQLAPSIATLATFLGWSVFIVALSAGFWWVFERQTPLARAWVERQLQSARVALRAKPGIGNT